MTRTPLSRSKGQGHQAALLIAVLASQAAVAVGVGTCWPWETAATFAVCSAARATWAPTGQERGGGVSWRPPAYSLLVSIIIKLTIGGYVVIGVSLFLFVSRIIQ